ncbi:hypothetical protein [Cellulomonas soli]|uniref:Integral membrane protein n=1 Tax=Cellulomonas soli TaxID=931535 RepID=A0A512PDB8_9CELL|nr:hypothetical protein [Cellulomonas soli]NYI60138.1 putative membrane protein [Cellulomonas soli]GEP69209.1 hypothetical protein CSO01_19240 [Cellulomonas soli]
MSENTGGTPPQGDQPEPTTPPAPVPPVPPAPAVPPAPPAGAVPPPPPGAYPPPAGAYGQPAPGAYPPPAPGAYPPPAAGYQAAPSSTAPIGEALTYGWNKFTQNGGTFIIAGLIWILGAAVVWGILLGIFGGLSAIGGDSGSGLIGAGFSIVWSLLAAIGVLFGLVVEAVFIRAALQVTYGRPVELKTFFDFSDLGPIVITALLFAGVNFVLSLVPFFGTLASIVVNFFVFFTLFFVIDKKLQPIDAIKASVALVQANLSTTVLFYLLVSVLIGVGFALCGLGLFVAVPVALLASAFFYRRLLGEPVAP